MDAAGSVNVESGNEIAVPRTCVQIPALAALLAELEAGLFRR